MINGHCGQCHKVWTLETEQGLCHWCGKLATCQSQRTQALRGFKSSGKRRQRQAQAHNNGYDQLEGNWAIYYKVASQFSHKAKAQDRGDLLHDVILTLANVERNNGHKPFTELAMYRIASVTVADYWRAQYKLTNGLDCGSCSKAQRQKCKADDLYSRCPKAIKMESLSKPIIDGEGNITELGELIADDKAIDLADWLDVKTFLLGCPQRLIAVAQKVREGEALDSKDQKYLWRFRQKSQIRMSDFSLKSRYI